MLSAHTLQTVSQPLENPRSHIVSPGVPFKLPCPICRWPFELSQYCAHYGDITTLYYSIEDPLEDHLHHPFKHLRNIYFTKPDNAQRQNHLDQQNVPPYSSLTPPPSYHNASPSPFSP